MSRRKGRKVKGKKGLSSLPAIAKEIGDFFSDEEGRVSKKDVTRLGVSLAVLGMMLKANESFADTVHTNTYPGHNSAFDAMGHNSMAIHSNHASHSSHSNGSWMC